MVIVLEAARRLGKHPETIRRWVRSGKLSARKIGQQHMIDEDDLPGRSAAAMLPDAWGRTITGGFVDTG